MCLYTSNVLALQKLPGFEPENKYCLWQFNVHAAIYPAGKFLVNLPKHVMVVIEC